MSLEEPQDGSQRRSDFRIKPGHREGMAATVFVPPVNPLARLVLRYLLGPACRRDWLGGR